MHNLIGKLKRTFTAIALAEAGDFEGVKAMLQQGAHGCICAAADVPPDARAAQGSGAARGEPGYSGTPARD